MPPAAVTIGLIFVIAWAKDAAPWPIYLIAALALVACAGWTVLVHSQGRRPGR
jgi:hypothetical protein